MTGVIEMPSMVYMYTLRTTFMQSQSLPLFLHLASCMVRLLSQGAEGRCIGLISVEFYIMQGYYTILILPNMVLFLVNLVYYLVSIKWKSLPLSYCHSKKDGKRRLLRHARHSISINIISSISQFYLCVRYTWNSI